MNLLQIQEPEPVASKLVIGIDLGTTNSLAAVYLDSQVEIIGKGLLPSIVTYVNEQIIVGDHLNQGVTIKSIKRLMGKKPGEVSKEHSAFNLMSSDRAGDNIVRLDVGKRQLTPIEISAEILKKLVAMASDHLHQEIIHAVITVPAYFDEAARSATKMAAKLAGINVLRLINEPTAAALAYGLDKEAQGLYLVYDLGGGTFDVSLLNMQEGVFQVIATGGDTSLGGDDIDYLICQHLFPHLAGVEPLSLLAHARDLKEQLTDQATASIMISGQQYKLTRPEFDQLIAPLIDRTINIVSRTLQDANVGISEVKGTILVGGSSRLALVKAKLTAFANRPPLDDINPDEAVAIGAAICAAGLSNSSSHLLLDVIALSLGLEMMGGVMEKIIQRNSPIPCAFSQEFTTYVDNQTAISFHVLQGEREMAADCRSLAFFELKDLPVAKAGMVKVKVSFMVDVDGLLTVSATEETKNISHNIKVHPSHGLSDQEVEQMLLESMKHAKTDIAKRLLAESRAEGKHVMQSVKVVLNEDQALATEQELTLINQRLSQLDDALIGSDHHLITQQVKLLEEAMESVIAKKLEKFLSNNIKGKHVTDIS